MIPEDVRKSLNIKPGMRVSVIAKGGVAFLVPARSLKEIQEKLAGLREKKDREV